MPFRKGVFASGTCFLGLLLHRVMRLRLKTNSLSLSPERVMEQLKRIQHHRVVLDGQRHTGITKLAPDQLKLFEALEVNRPAESAL